MVDHEIDGLGNTSASYQYGSAYGGLYPTTVTNALGQATTYSYDLNTGQKTTVTDPNQNTTAYTYYNDGRLSKVNFPDMGSTQWVYSTDTMPPTQQSPATITGIAQTGAPEGAISSAAVFDGLGRLVERQLLTDPAGADIAEIAYDGLGHVVEESTPYRAGAGSPGISSYAYDALGRMVLHVLPDSSTEQWCYDGLVTASQLNIVTALSGNLRCPGLLSKNASGSWLDYFDEAGQHTQRVKDVLGRLTAVMEPGPATNIPSIETD
jgi:YD repeat-containing protein